MTVVIEDSEDLTLDTLHRIAWQGSDCTISAIAAERIRRRRGEFLEFVDNNMDKHLYGVTTKHHVGAKSVLSEGSRREYASRLPTTPATLGQPLPERLLRAAIVARLADVLNGTACLRIETVSRLLGMLNDELPHVPAQGNGEPGDIIPLGHLFRRHFDGTLELGEGMALINGSPVAAAALADATLQGRQHIRKIEYAFAMAALAMRSPSAHYAADLGEAWRDPYQAQALEAMRHLLGEGARKDELAYQAPVSFRSAPRLLGWLRRTQAMAEECANIALKASSNNPIFCSPQSHPPFGAVLSNGGYHNPLVAPTLDSLTRAWADICQLATAQVNRLVELPDGLLVNEPEAQISLFYMTSSGWAEEARTAATASLTGIGGGSQTDTGTPDLLAWRKSQDVGQALDANLSTLLMVASHTLARKDLQVSGILGGLHSRVLDIVPLGTDAADFGGCLAALVDLLNESHEPAALPA